MDQWGASASLARLRLSPTLGEGSKVIRVWTYDSSIVAGFKLRRAPSARNFSDDKAPDGQQLWYSVVAFRMTTETGESGAVTTGPAVTPYGPKIRPATRRLRC